MSYLVLARKYRPQKLTDVIGQEHITEILGKSIQGNRLAQAYLFCGPRGIGKTSCARILAKSLNCEKGPTLEPCGSCSACREIAQANSFDVLEIDGASNRGIDEIRTLRENVKFAPSYGRFKIYIVDEVHMLTMEAFNALLKTLEEPPPHVKFIFATTSPNKVPSTIISRCQRFDFKRISIQTTTQLLTKICQQENFTIDQEAVFAVAKAASGSLRDALSILDQLSALSDRSIKAADVFSMLGLVETESLFNLVDCLTAHDCSGALEAFDQVIEQGKDIKQLSRDLTEHFRHLMIVKIGGKTLSRLIDYPSANKDQLLAQSEKLSLPEILKAIETFIEAQEVSRITESQRMPLEIAFAKLTFKEETQLKQQSVSQPTAARVAPSPAPAPQKPATTSTSFIKNEKGQVNVSIPSKPETKMNPTPNRQDSVSAENAKQNDSLNPNEPGEILDLEKIKRGWDALTYAVSREKMSVATYLQEGTPVALKGTKLTVGFPSQAAFHKESLEEKENIKLVERIFAEKLKSRVILEFTIVDGHKPVHEQEAAVKNLLETFKGKVVNQWHNE